jgi:hypothetical protein
MLGKKVVREEFDKPPLTVEAASFDCHPMTHHDVRDQFLHVDLSQPILNRSSKVWDS